MLIELNDPKITNNIKYLKLEKFEIVKEPEIKFNENENEKENQTLILFFNLAYILDCNNIIDKSDFDFEILIKNFNENKKYIKKEDVEFSFEKNHQSFYLSLAKKLGAFQVGILDFFEEIKINFKEFIVNEINKIIKKQNKKD